MLIKEATGRELEWADCSLIIGTGCRFQFLAWSSIAQSVCQRAFSLLAIWCLRPWVQILHSAKEDYLSPFDLNNACHRNQQQQTYMNVCLGIYVWVCMYDTATVFLEQKSNILTSVPLCHLLGANILWYITVELSSAFKRSSCLCHVFEFSS